MLILDKSQFPRDKVCAGWITPQVVEELEIDTRDYEQGRVLQPITGFVTGMGERVVGEGWHLTLGLLFVLVVIFLPGGIMEGARRLGALFRRPTPPPAR